jgi:hypothetical protein
VYPTFFPKPFKHNVRITTVSNVVGLTSSTDVPSNAHIAVFGEGVSSQPYSYGGNRTIQTSTDVFLGNISKLVFYVNRGGSGWGNIPYDNLILQFSNSTSGPWTNIASIVASSYTSNVWTRVEIGKSTLQSVGAINYGNVYLRFSTQVYFATGDYSTWAVSSISAIYDSDISYTDDTSTNATYYPSVTTETSGGSLKISSTKLTYNPSTGNLTSTSVSDSAGNLRKLPNIVKTAGYALTIGDVGELINISTGGVTVPANVFSPGDAITIYNNSSSSQSITASGVTLRQAGTSGVGSRTLTQYGVCTVLCVVGQNEFVISGAGLL